MLATHIFNVSDFVLNNRSPITVLTKLMEEVGELSTEIAIDCGISSKQPSEDGILGECVDVLITVFDIIKLHQPNITEEELLKVVELKCNKWINTTKK